MEQIFEFKNRPGKTLIACGEYNTKGSLEMYGLSPNPLKTVISTNISAGSLQDSVMKNRQTSSSSKLLSVSNHGTRIVVSDGGGNLKWLERDGFTEARRWNIAHGSVEAPQGIFGTLGDSYMDSGSGDIVLKLICCTSGKADELINDGKLALWTGDKVGLLSFSSKPGFNIQDFEEIANTAEEAAREREERVYSTTSKHPGIAWPRILAHKRSKSRSHFEARFFEFDTWRDCFTVILLTLNSEASFRTSSQRGQVCPRTRTRTWPRISMNTVDCDTCVRCGSSRSNFRSLVG